MQCINVYFRKNDITETTYLVCFCKAIFLDDNLACSLKLIIVFINYESGVFDAITYLHPSIVFAGEARSLPLQVNLG